MKNKLFEKLVDDNYRYRIQLLVIPAIFCIVSAGMCILNIFTHKTMLMYATLIFSIVSALNVLITYFSKKSLTLPKLLFVISIMSLFVYFLLFGGTEGFSPIWICLLPSCGIWLLGRRDGSIVCAVMLAIIIFLFWTPAGQGLLQYQFTESFLMRFPLVYVSSYAVGLFFENVRYITSRQLVTTQQKYRELSNRDALTGLYNRQWFNETLDKISGETLDCCSCLMIADVDHFKRFNDIYGHLFGDEVLKRIAGVIAETSSGTVCRWGGEEFAILLRETSSEFVRAEMERIRTAVENIRIELSNGETARLTISVGGVIFNPADKFKMREITADADAALYEAKDNGRNCTVLKCKAAAEVQQLHI